MLAPERYLRATIRWRRDYSADLWSVGLELPEPLRFRPGQYATLALEDDTGIHERPYSIVSSPEQPGLEFFFELVPGGELTPRLYRLATGDAVWVRRAAKGLFQLDTVSGRRRHLLVATVTGLAPFLSILRTLAANGPPAASAPATIALVAAASRSWEFGYREEIEQQLAPRLPALHPVFSVSRPWEDTAWQGERGRAEDILRKYADAHGCAAEAATAYLCGHPQMIANAKAILARCGFPSRSIHEEVYWIPSKSQPESPNPPLPRSPGAGT
ncbi:MAG: FAD-binding oxidoreductase [Terriglobales bacterium]